MHSSLTGLAASVDSSLTQDFLRGALRGLARANREANRYCAQFEKPERVDLFGHLERALFERNLKKAANDSGLVSKSRKNAASTSHYVQVECGTLIITASAVELPGDLPRNANFRNSLAKAGQTSLLRLMGEAPEIGDGIDCIYAILTHCTSRDGALIDARIVVPNETGKRKLYTKLLRDELVAAVEDVKESETLAPVEEVAEVELELRAKPQKVASE